jgi:hypothetical protein
MTMDTTGESSLAVDMTTKHDHNIFDEAFADIFTENYCSLGYGEPEDVTSTVGTDQNHVDICNMLQMTANSYNTNLVAHTTESFGDGADWCLELRRTSFHTCDWISAEIPVPSQGHSGYCHFSDVVLADQTQISEGCSSKLGNFNDNESNMARKRERSRSGKSSDNSVMPRRKKIALDSSQTRYFEQWLLANKADPYPDRKTKSDLAKASGLTLRQVEAWFSRTRQRKLVRVHHNQRPASGQKEVVHRMPVALGEADLHDICFARPLCCNFRLPLESISLAEPYARPPHQRKLDLGGSSHNLEDKALRRARSCPPSIQFKRLLLESESVSLYGTGTNDGTSLQVGLSSPPHINETAVLADRSCTQQLFKRARTVPPRRGCLAHSDVVH